jgi:hypothetical protein
MDYSENSEETCRKRTINENDEVVKLSLISQNTVSSPKKVKLNYKELTGQLMHKTRLSINNEFFYTFGFLSDNKIKDYYGNAKIFSELHEGKCYHITLNYVKTKNTERIEVNDYKECEIKNEITSPVDYFLTNKHFEDEEKVNTIAKFKYIFKKLNSNMYKIMFEINYRNLNDDITVVQVECAATEKSLMNIFKTSTATEDDDINALITYTKRFENKIYNLYNIKCQKIIQNPNVYYNWNTINATRLEICENVQNEMCDSLIHSGADAKINISRSNKYVYHCNVTNIKIELDEGDSGNNRFLVQFKSDDPMFNENLNDIASTSLDINKWNKSIFYVNTNKKTEADNLPKLAADLNQIEELLEDGLIKIDIYFTVDDSKNINILSILKCSVEDNDCLFL